MVKLINPHTKEWLIAPLGASFTMFFFHALVPLYRGEGGFFWKFCFLSMITFYIYPFIQIFTYNKGYIQRKLNQGWLPADQNNKEILLSQGVICSNVYEGEEITTPYKPNRFGFYLFLVICVLFFLLMIAAASAVASSY